MNTVGVEIQIKNDAMNKLKSYQKELEKTKQVQQNVANATKKIEDMQVAMTNDAVKQKQHMVKRMWEQRVSEAKKAYAVLLREAKNDQVKQKAILESYKQDMAKLREGMNKDLAGIGGKTSFFDGLKDKFSQLVPMGGQFGDMLGGIGGKLVGIGTAIAVAIGAFKKFYDVIMQGLESLKMFDYGVAQTASLMTGMDQASRTGFLQDFEIGLKSIRTTSGDTFESLTKSLYDLQSAGQGGAEAITNLEIASKAGIAGASDTATAVDIMTTTLNAFSAQGYNTNQVMDILFKGIEQGKTTLSEMNASFGNVASIAAKSNISLETTVGTIAELTKQGQKTAVAVTNVTGLIRDFGRAEIQKNFEKIGIGVVDAEGRLRDFGDVFTELVSTGLDFSKTDVLNSLGLGDEAKKAFTALLGTVELEGGKVVSTLEATLSQFDPSMVTGSMEAAFQVMDDTLIQQEKRIEGLSEVLVMNIAKPFQGLEKVYTDAKESVFSFLVDMTSSSIELAKRSSEEAKGYQKTANAMQDLKREYIETVKNGGDVSSVLDKIEKISPETAMQIKRLGSDVDELSMNFVAAVGAMDKFTNYQKGLADVEAQKALANMGDELKSTQKIDGLVFDYDLSNLAGDQLDSYRDKLTAIQDDWNLIAERIGMSGVAVEEMTAAQIMNATSLVEIDDKRKQLMLEREVGNITATELQEELAELTEKELQYKENILNIQKTIEDSAQIILSTAETEVDVENAILGVTSDIAQQEALRAAATKQLRDQLSNVLQAQDAQKLGLNQLLNIQNSLTQAGYFTAKTDAERVTAINSVLKGLKAERDQKVANLKLTYKDLMAEYEKASLIGKISIAGQIATAANEIRALDAQITAVSQIPPPQIAKPETVRATQAVADNTRSTANSSSQTNRNLSDVKNTTSDAAKEAERLAREIAKANEEADKLRQALDEALKNLSKTLTEFLTDPPEFADKYEEEIYKIGQAAENFTEKYLKDIEETEKKLMEMEGLKALGADISDEELREYESKIQDFKDKVVDIEVKTQERISAVQIQKIDDELKRTKEVNDQYLEEKKQANLKTQQEITDSIKKDQLELIESQLNDTGKALLAERDSYEERLYMLKQLYNEGVISAEELEKKRNEITKIYSQKRTKIFKEEFDNIISNFNKAFDDLLKADKNASDPLGQLLENLEESADDASKKIIELAKGLQGELIAGWEVFNRVSTSRENVQRSQELEKLSRLIRSVSSEINAAAAETSKLENELRNVQANPVIQVGMPSDVSIKQLQDKINQTLGKAVGDSSVWGLKKAFDVSWAKSHFEKALGVVGDELKNAIENPTKETIDKIYDYFVVKSPGTLPGLEAYIKNVRSELLPLTQSLSTEQANYNQQLQQYNQQLVNAQNQSTQSQEEIQKALEEQKKRQRELIAQQDMLNKKFEQTKGLSEFIQSQGGYIIDEARFKQSLIDAGKSIAQGSSAQQVVSDIIRKGIQDGILTTMADANSEFRKALVERVGQYGNSLKGIVRDTQDLNNITLGSLLNTEQKTLLANKAAAELQVKLRDLNQTPLTALEDSISGVEDELSSWLFSIDNVMKVIGRNDELSQLRNELALAFSTEKINQFKEYVDDTIESTKELMSADSIREYNNGYEKALQTLSASKSLIDNTIEVEREKLRLSGLTSEQIENQVSQYEEMRDSVNEQMNAIRKWPIKYMQEQRDIILQELNGLQEITGIYAQHEQAMKQLSSQFQVRLEQLDQEKKLILENLEMTEQEKQAALDVWKERETTTLQIKLELEQKERAKFKAEAEALFNGINEKVKGTILSEFDFGQGAFDLFGNMEAAAKRTRQEFEEMKESLREAGLLTQEMADEIDLAAEASERMVMAQEVNNFATAIKSVANGVTNFVDAINNADGAFDKTMGALNSMSSTLSAIPNAYTQAAGAIIGAFTGIAGMFKSLFGKDDKARLEELRKEEEEIANELQRQLEYRRELGEIHKDFIEDLRAAGIVGEKTFNDFTNGLNNFYDLMGKFSGDNSLGNFFQETKDKMMDAYSIDGLAPFFNETETKNKEYEKWLKNVSEIEKDLLAWKEKYAGFYNDELRESMSLQDQFTAINEYGLVLEETKAEIINNTSLTEGQRAALLAEIEDEIIRQAEAEEVVLQILVKQNELLDRQKQAVVNIKNTLKELGDDPFLSADDILREIEAIGPEAANAIDKLVKEYADAGLNLFTDGRDEYFAVLAEFGADGAKLQQKLLYAYRDDAFKVADEVMKYQINNGMEAAEAEAQALASKMEAQKKIIEDLSGTTFDELLTRDMAEIPLSVLAEMNKYFDLIKENAGDTDDAVKSITDTFSSQLSVNKALMDYFVGQAETEKDKFDVQKEYLETQLEILNAQKAVSEEKLNELDIDTSRLNEANYLSELSEKQLKAIQDYYSVASNVMDVEFQLLETFEGQTGELEDQLELRRAAIKLMDSRISLEDQLMNYEIARAEYEKGSELTEKEKLDIQNKYLANQQKILETQQAQSNILLTQLGINKNDGLTQEEIAGFNEEQLQALQDHFKISEELYKVQIQLKQTVEDTDNALEELTNTAQSQLSLIQSQLSNKLKLLEIENGYSLTEEQRQKASLSYWNQQESIISSHLASLRRMQADEQTILEWEGKLLDIQMEKLNIQGTYEDSINNQIDRLSNQLAIELKRSELTKGRELTEKEINELSLAYWDDQIDIAQEYLNQLIEQNAAKEKIEEWEAKLLDLQIEKNRALKEELDMTDEMDEQLRQLLIQKQKLSLAQAQGKSVSYEAIANVDTAIARRMDELSIPQYETGGLNTSPLAYAHPGEAIFSPASTSVLKDLFGTNNLIRMTQNPDALTQTLSGMDGVALSQNFSINVTGGGNSREIATAIEQRLKNIDWTSQMQKALRQTGRRIGDIG